MKIGIDIFSLAAKTALISGATGYLGRAMAFSLAEAGAHVLVNGRDAERVRQLVRELQSGGWSAEGAVFDITNDEAIRRFVAERAGQALHVLVNNAYLGGGGTIAGSGGAAYAASYEVTLVAAHNLLRATLPLLRRGVAETGEASVINMGSMYGMVSPDPRLYDTPQGTNPPFYGAAKAALLQWSRYAACEFGGEGIRVNAISPGPFPSAAVQQSNPDFVNKLSAKVPMGRVGLAAELKGPVLFLASSASSYVNGANLVVDGGWTCW